jgi:NAD(P)-dependent dehydrogenase (short-subunit alcohol dehydrogenase family)
LKTFLSIGTGPGIGFATAARFAKEGFRILLSARDLKRTQTLAEQLNAAGHEAEAFHIECSDPSAIVSLIAQTEERHGAIDVLNYNAASMRKATIDEQPSETFNNDLAINLGGALTAVQFSAARMEKRNAGTILLTGGGFSLQPNPDFISLSIAKAGIRNLTLALFTQFKERGIHIATVTVAAFVSPGSTAAEAVGDCFWRLHDQSKDAWVPEATYTDAGWSIGNSLV